MILMPHPRDFTSGRYKIRIDRNRQPPDRRRPAALGAARAVRHGDASVGSRSCPTTTSARSSATSRRCRRDSPPSSRSQSRAATPVPPSPESVDARRSRVREAAVRQVPRRRRARHRRRGDVVRGRLGLSAARRRPERTVDLPRRATAADVFMRFRAGMSGTPMPSYQGTGNRRRDVGPRELRRLDARESRCGR